MLIFLSPTDPYSIGIVTSDTKFTTNVGCSLALAIDGTGPSREGAVAQANQPALSPGEVTASVGQLRSILTRVAWVFGLHQTNCKRQYRSAKAYCIYHNCMKGTVLFLFVHATHFLGHVFLGCGCSVVDIILEFCILFILEPAVGTANTEMKVPLVAAQGFLRFPLSKPGFCDSEYRFACCACSVTELLTCLVSVFPQS